MLQGSIPSPANPPSGCKFHPLPYATERCKTEAPKQREAEPGHYVVCHLYEMRRDDFEDDGRTIADMSDIGPAPMLRPTAKTDARAGERPSWEQAPTGRQRKFWAVMVC